MPRPDQTLCLPSFCILSLRAAFAATCRTKPLSSREDLSVRSSLMFKLRQTSDQATFYLRDRVANIAFPVVDFQELALHRVIELSEIRSADGTTHGYRHLGACFDQHPFIYSDVSRLTILDRKSTRLNSSHR